MSTPTAYVSIGDTHIGCKLGLMPPESVIDFGVSVGQSPASRWVWDNVWTPFWDEFVPWATGGEPYIVCHGGDIVDGVHHHSTTQVTQDMEAQEKMAVAVMRPHVDAASTYFQLAGTDAHDGQSWANARRIAQQLGSPDSGRDDHLWPELRIMIGDALVHDTHHVSTTGLHKSMTTGITSDAIEQFVTASKAGTRCPDVFLRHHCHHASRSGGFLRDPCHWWQAMSVPGWQLKGPYPWKVGARNHITHFGGAVVRWVTNPWGAGHAELLPFTRSAGQSAPVILRGYDEP